MKRNVGGVDKLVRIAIGSLVFSLALLLDGGMRWWGLVGLVPLLTAAFGYCPLYSPFGLDTTR